jgi:hypothetical protein
MFLTRKGYHFVVISWLAVMCVIDVVANTMLTGVMSDVYFWKIVLDAGLMWWTWNYLRDDLAGNVVDAAKARSMLDAERRRMGATPDRAPSRGDESILGSTESLGAIEYIYYFFMVAYGGGNLIFHHAINKASTGSLSLTTMILSGVDLIVVVVAAVNLWRMFGGKVVRFTRSLTAG